ncbi:MAG: NAD(P)/FAD-dependent oxidoreductase [bacterium]|nr:NAD(P)/FAD-dependent oxidoreductase [bacterium]
MTEHRKPQIVIIGGGFGGLNAAKALRDAPADVTLIDKRNFHLFQPLLYQVATGALSPANIAAPLRALVAGQANTRVVLGEVAGFAPAENRVILGDGSAIPYDSLIVAAGMRNSYFGNDQWEQYAPGLKTIEDATDIRGQLLTAFERAEQEPDPDRVRSLLTFVVVGGGPTGVELAGALSEIARYTLRGNFRRIDPAAARIILVEGLDRVLSSYTENLSAYARRTLESMGIEVRLGTFVQAVDAEGVTVKTGETLDRIEAQTVLWGAGVRASELGAALAAATSAETDRPGRVIVAPDTSIPGHPNIFVIGDLAHFKGSDGKPLPGVAQVAIQQGKFAAAVIKARLRGQPAPTRFVYRDLGNMATIGRAAAVADLHLFKLKGVIGWLAWLFIHLMQLVSFQNRMLVFLQWAWSYFTRNRAARLITAEYEPYRPQ